MVFKRQLVGPYRDEWIELQQILDKISLQPLQLDKLIWRWNSSSIFSVHFFYAWLDYRGIDRHEFDVIWHSKLSLKIKAFMWLVRRKKILTKDVLIRRGWTENSSCMFCNCDEAADHLFVTYTIAQTIWNWISQFNNFVFSSTSLSNL